MIAEVAFGPSAGRLRTLRFTRRTSVPLAAACGVAERLRASLDAFFGGGCELVLGEPVPLARDAWPLLAGDALLFRTRGRPTDIVLVVPRSDARRLVLHAFGEPDAGTPDAAWSALERRALAGIAARCAAAFDPLCGERDAGAVPVEPDEVPACAAYFDVRVRLPIAVTLGVGVVRDLPPPPPAGAVAAGVLESIGLDVRAVLGEGCIAAATLAALAPGAIVKLNTKVGGPISLNVAGNHVAFGIPGVVALRNAVSVRDVPGAHLR